MSHMSPFRLNVQNIASELSTSSSNPKKRRKNVQTPIQTPTNVQDLLPPPLSGYGDTIVASNPFDDCPSNVNSMNVRNMPPMGMGPNMSMGVNNMNMCRPMGPAMQGPGPMGPGPINNGPQMNGPMTAGMNMSSPNGPIGPPHNNFMMSPMNTMYSKPMPGPMPGNMGGPGPMNNGPQMNGPMSAAMNMSSPNGPIVGPPHNNNFMMSPMNTMYSKPMPVSAGKVYPADQPMVFNSQNPNAPPIYPCGVCHKEVHDNDQAILCESGCNFWFHRGCTGLTEAAFQLLTAEVYAEWVCDKCLSSKNIPLVKFKP
ncbi:protein pygopus isoform X2 [Tribolium castaneum]|uniref:protein pygopus isoform X2 n=1 Tax=Tribolium castaneum TaxID=7070 RepID=UPI00046C087C|nr:PREDICTED: protein pygopus isoform X2 [Tribolium castaneum]|eukprot:XP_008198545.1 PREDICTED: protein pygopus isoform X2 [Tribolium castaneum]